MDVIASTFFGTKIDSQNDPNNAFVKTAKSVFDGGFFSFTLLIYCEFKGLLLLELFQLSYLDELLLQSYSQDFGPLQRNLALRLFRRKPWTFSFNTLSRSLDCGEQPTWFVLYTFFFFFYLYKYCLLNPDRF